MDSAAVQVMPSKAPVWRSVVQAYRDVGRAVAAMPLLATGAFAIYLLSVLLDQALLPQMYYRTAAHLISDLAILAATSFLVAPFLIAINQFIILEGITSRYQIDLSARFWRYFMWSFVLFDLPQAILYVAPLLDQISSSWSNDGWILILGITAAVIFLLSACFVTLFPAIAVDAAGANLRSAYRDTSGKFWRILAIIVLATLPIIVLVYVADSALRAFYPAPELAAGLGSTALSAVYAAIGSRLFQRIRGKMPQSPPT